MLKGHCTWSFCKTNSLLLAEMGCFDIDLAEISQDLQDKVGLLKF